MQSLAIAGQAELQWPHGSAQSTALLPLSSLTFEHTQRSGLPVYQTWFVSRTRDITGTVVDEADGPVSGVEVTLTDDGGVVLATTTSEKDGSYQFPEWFATDDYELTFSVQMERPSSVTTHNLLI